MSFNDIHQLKMLGKSAAVLPRSSLYKKIHKIKLTGWMWIMPTRVATFLVSYCKCNFPMTQSVCLLVCRLVADRSVCLFFPSKFSKRAGSHTSMLLSEHLLQSKPLKHYSCPLNCETTRIQRKPPFLTFSNSSFNSFPLRILT